MSLFLRPFAAVADLPTGQPNGTVAYVEATGSFYVVVAGAWVAAGGGAGGGPTRPPLVGDELLVWRANEAAGSLINSGSGAAGDLALTGAAPTYRTPGPFAAAISRPAGAGYYTGAAGVDTALAAVSLSYWIRPTTFGVERIVGKAGVIISANQAGYPDCTIYTGGGVMTAQAAEPINLRTWNHVACVYDGATLKVYVNGLLSTTSAAIVGVVAANANVWAAYATDAGGAPYSGSLAEVRVQPSALTAAQIRAQYVAGMGWGVQ